MDSVKRFFQKMGKEIKPESGPGSILVDGAYLVVGSAIVAAAFVLGKEPPVNETLIILSGFGFLGLLYFWDRDLSEKHGLFVSISALFLIAGGIFCEFAPNMMTAGAIGIATAVLFRSVEIAFMEGDFLG